MHAPDFVGIGFQRCATSWAKACLTEHPAIGIRTDSIHFFSENLAKGREWYFQQLAALGTHSTRIDLSVSYGYPEYVHGCAAEIAKGLPDVNIFAFVRHPVERAYSDYQRALFRGELAQGTGVERALAQRPEFIERGRYARLLGAVLEHIPRDRLRIFFFQDIAQQPHAAWQEICEYLRVDTAFRPAFLEQRTNHATMARNPALVAAMRSTYRFAKKMPGVSPLMQRLKSRPSWQTLTNVLMRQPAAMPAVVSEQLHALYEPDVQFLEELTDRNLSAWRR